MPKRTPNPNRVKAHRIYAIDEAARTLDVHKHTVDRWIKKEGLAAITDRRPYLIPGDTLKAFLREKRERNRSRCGPGEFYCFKCRAPRRPTDGYAVYEPLSARHGNLAAICGTCDAFVHRTASKADLAALRQYIAITERE